MPGPILTSRLKLDHLTVDDHGFVQELVNTKGWLEFIGNRNVNSKSDAIDYVNKILSAAHIIYWVVRLKEENIPIGIISFIKRDYLASHDLGFAFLPGFIGLGYAQEAAKEVMSKAFQSDAHPCLLATTIPQNTSSIKLLKKLGFQFKEQIEVENEVLHVYSVSNDNCKL